MCLNNYELLKTYVLCRYIINNCFGWDLGDVGSLVDDVANNQRYLTCRQIVKSNICIIRLLQRVIEDFFLTLFEKDNYTHWSV